MEKRAGRSDREPASTMERRKYPIRPEDYELYEEVGQGGSAVVYRALCVPFNEVVAVKVVDFEKARADLDNIRREAQTMILIDHPNVLKAHCSFVNDHTLWVVMPYMAGGSCLHILKAAYPDGLEETVIATVLRDALKGVAYLHHQGHIHRDIKAGNILVDADGGVKLGDFGVSACFFDSGDRQRSRNTFVGTPCWMAPEVMEQLHGYDFKADIWSFGITALELAHGHAPFSKYPPLKVLLMTLQNAPPGLDYERDRKFSKSFKQMIAMCLVKDPSKRPSAEKLLKHSFFKHGRSNDYLVRTILDGLPTLGDRIRALKDKEAAMLAQEKMPYGQKEELSQSEYKRGISGWNFNIEDVKAQASLIPDGDEVLPTKDQMRLSNSASALCNAGESDPSIHYDSADEVELETESAKESEPVHVRPSDKISYMLERKHDSSEDETIANGIVLQEDSKQNGFALSDHCAHEVSRRPKELFTDSMDNLARQVPNGRELPGSKPLDVPLPRGESDSPETHHNHSSVLGQVNFDEANKGVSDATSENILRTSKLPASNGDENGDKTKGPVVQQRGRFKVTSENVEKTHPSPALPCPVLLKSHSFQTPHFPPSLSEVSPSPHIPNYLHLQNILQQINQIRDCVLSMMKEMNGSETGLNNCACSGQKLTASTITDKTLLEAAYEKEKELIQDLTDTRWRLICATDEMQKMKMKQSQV